MKNYVIKGNVCYSKSGNELCIVENGYVVCENGYCAGVYRKLPECYETFPNYDYTDKIIIPGLVDLHVHAPQYSFRGMGMDLELIEYLKDKRYQEIEQEIREVHKACKGRILKVIIKKVEFIMDFSVIIKIIGYMGSSLVVLSMLMSSIVKLRMINTAGCCISATYALIIHSYPLALMNICLIAINIYNLIKLLKTEQHYSLVCIDTNNSLLDYLLSFYSTQMHA